MKVNWRDRELVVAPRDGSEGTGRVQRPFSWLYNTYRPHSALGGLTSAEYAEKWTINQPSRP